MSQNKQPDPIDSVIWKHRDNIKPNGYNPNKQAPPELDLLEISILEDGYTQPIVLDEDDNIVDGFHRWEISGRPKVYEKYKGYLPCVTLHGKGEADKKISTIRHNRARGTHGVLRMSDIVIAIAASGISIEEIMKRLGMDSEEVKRLTMRGGVIMNEIGKESDWSKSWVPKFDEK